MTHRMHSWLVMELGDPYGNRRLRNPLFGAVELTPQFMRCVRRLERLARTHQIDLMQTRAIDTKVFWDISVEDGRNPDAISLLHICGEHFIFQLDYVHPASVLNPTIESVGQTFCIALEELELYYWGPDRIHFLEIFDWDEPADDDFMPMVLKRMLELEQWDAYQEEIHRLLNERG